MTQSEIENKATIEERAIEYQGQLASSFLGFPDLLEGAYHGYIKGATEQHKIDIDKACEWLKEHAMYYGYASGIDATYAYDADMLVKNFRKAMEKQD